MFEVIFTIPCGDHIHRNVVTCDNRDDFEILLELAKEIEGAGGKAQIPVLN